MGTTDLVVATVIVLVSLGLLWFFFGSRPGAQRAEHRGAAGWDGQPCQ